MAEEKKEERKKENTKSVTTGALLKDLISGSMVTERIILKNLGYILMLTLLGAIYIANRFHAEKLTRETTRLQKEVKDLRSESLSVSASLMYSSKQSEVFRLVKEKGLNLEELREPPFKLIVNKK
jgi:Bacteriodetes cell division protein (FtsL-like)